MALSVYKSVILSSFVVSGAINTLSTKWADESEAPGLEPDKPHRKFDHPFVQACGMFIGEFLCFVVYWIWRRWSVEGRVSVPVPVSKWFLFIVPAVCDLIATSTMYIALNLTYASSFQMLRGAVVIFTGLLSVAFLGSTILAFMWIGIATLTVGLIIIGLSDTVFNGESADPNGIVSGDLLIILAQIICAIQFVYEEKFIKRHNFAPLLVVGLEGMFGFVILAILLVPMYYIPASPPFSSQVGHLEDAWDAFAQLGQNWQIVVATVGNILSIAFFNFCGITITKLMSATTRQVLDSARTLIIWIVSLGVSWQPFDYRSFLLQLAGFVLIGIGMMVYNDLVFRPFLIRHKCLSDRQSSPYNINAAQDEDEDSQEVNGDDDDDDQQMIIA